MKRGMPWKYCVLSMSAVFILFYLVVSADADVVYTEDLAPDGTITASSYYGSRLPEHVTNGMINQNDASGWTNDGYNDSEPWIKCDFGSGNGKRINKMSFIPYFNGHGIKTWVLEGSNNDTDWETIAAGEEPHEMTEKTYEFSNSNSYQYYRFSTSEWHLNNTWMGLVDWKLFGAVGSSASISLEPDNSTPVAGDTVCINVNVSDASGLYSAAFDLAYDHAVLQYLGTSEGDFFNKDGETTFFDSSLLNDDAANDTVVVGVSRVSDADEVAGSGTIATTCFSVVSGTGSDTGVSIVSGYFEGATSGTVVDVNYGEAPVIAVEPGVPLNLSVTDPGTLDRLDLSWNILADALSYEIYRANASGGTYELIGTVSSAAYQDNNCLVTDAAYHYKVKAVFASGITSDLSDAASGSVAGLSGDINKDNRVDGRDLTILARAFNSSEGGDDYECLANLDRAGLIDGEDLVILTANFGNQL